METTFSVPFQPPRQRLRHVRLAVAVLVAAAVTGFAVAKVQAAAYDAPGQTGSAFGTGCSYTAAGTFWNPEGGFAGVNNSQGTCTEHIVNVYARINGTISSAYSEGWVTWNPTIAGHGSLLATEIWVYGQGKHFTVWGSTAGTCRAMSGGCTP